MQSYYSETVNLTKRYIEQLGRLGVNEFYVPQEVFVVKKRGKAKQLESMAAELADCARCDLSGGRTQVVFGDGSSEADLVFVGEAPGRDEDIKGEPFVGRAGQLLTKMIVAMGLTRDQVYICNVLKCRPPNNRDPLPDEVAICEPFLLKQLDIIQPKVIVALGRFAVQTLLRDSTPISRQRGKWRDYHGIRLMPTFHPSYLLRNPSSKRQVWDDLQEVMRELGLSLPEKSK